MGRPEYPIARLVGLALWWFALAVVAVIVGTVLGDVPLWAMIVASLILGGAAIPLMFWREIQEWRNGWRSGAQRAGMIALVEGVDLVWRVIRKNSTPPDWAGMERFQNLTHLMFSGRNNSVPLYGKSPPSQVMERIENSHKYDFNADGSAHKPLERDSRVVDLHVRREDAVRWAKDYVNQ